MIGVIEVISEYPAMTGTLEYFLQTGGETCISWVKQESIYEFFGV
jgi:hypothetical protein